VFTVYMGKGNGFNVIVTRTGKCSDIPATWNLNAGHTLAAHAGNAASSSR
jgi:hypothetical protein